MLTCERPWLAGVLLLLFSSPTFGAPGILNVSVTILPQKYLVERIGGDRVAVQVLVPPGKSHETYEPTPHQVAELAKGRIYFRIGLPLENSLLPKLQGAARSVRVVDVRQGIQLRRLEKENAAFEAAHDHAPESATESPDPHIWLSPVLAQRQAATVLAALVAEDPAGKEEDNAEEQECAGETAGPVEQAGIAPGN